MTLNQIRKKIDSIDTKLVKLIAERQLYMPYVAKYKKDNGLPIFQPKRENEVLKSKLGLAVKFGVNKVLVKKVFMAIFKNSRDIQKGMK